MMVRRYRRTSPVRMLVVAVACFSMLLLRHNGGGVIAQGNGGDDDASNDDGDSNDNDDSNDDDGSASFSPTGAPTSLNAPSDYPACTGYTSHIKDGYCDTDLNNADCGFDGGDCCACTCGLDDEDEELPHLCGQVGDGYDCKDPDVPADCGVTPSPASTIGYPDCTGYLYNFQNSYCNDDLNNAACGYDGGDCCRCTCRDYGYSSWSYYSACGYYGYDCLDPEAPSSCSTDSPTPSPAAGTDYPECEGYIFNVGNGYCDYSNNNEGCEWDGGDCCACTCENDYYTCGYYGYSCLDPTVSTDCSTSSATIYATNTPSYTPTYTTSSGGCESSYISDGYCDFINNNADCDWDGGDCCECDCVDSTFTCGGYSCVDPSSTCVSSTGSFYDDSFYGDDGANYNYDDDAITSNSPGYTPPVSDEESDGDDDGEGLGGGGDVSGDDDDGYGDRGTIATPSPVPLTEAEAFATDSSEPLLSSVEIGGVFVLSVFGFCFCGVAILAGFGLLGPGRRGKGSKGDAPGAGAAAVAAATMSSGRVQHTSPSPVAKEGPPLASTLAPSSAVPGNNSNVAPADDIEQRAGVNEQTARFGGGVGVEESKADEEAALDSTFQSGDGDGDGGDQAGSTEEADGGGGDGGGDGEASDDEGNMSHMWEEEKDGTPPVAAEVLDGDGDGDGGGDGDGDGGADGGAVEGGEKDAETVDKPEDTDGADGDNQEVKSELADEQC